jgi:hypothetical protein
VIETIGTQESGGQGRGTTPVTASAEVMLAYRITGAVEVTPSRAVERMGARIRAKGKVAQREQWAGVANADLARTLGAARVEGVLGADWTDSLRTEAASLASHAADWAASAEIPLALAVGRRVGDLAICLADEHVRSGAPTVCPLETVYDLLGLAVPVR